MTDREKVLCNGIIHTASLAAGAVVAGNIVNAGTAASITEAMGWKLAERFASDSQRVQKP